MSRSEAPVRISQVSPGLGSVGRGAAVRVASSASGAACCRSPRTNGLVWPFLAARSVMDAQDFTILAGSW